MVVLSAWCQHRLGGRGYSIPSVILGFILSAYPVSALDPTSFFSEYAATTWTHRDGLFSTFIRAIGQTADGYIWLGTTDGLFRFDGVRFVQWRNKQQHGLGVVNALCAARDGSLLVGTDAGLVGRLRGGDFVSIRSGAAIQSVLEDRDGTVWVTAGDRLIHYRSDLWSSAPVEVSLPANVLSGPLQDPSGSIWVSTEEGVERLEQNRLTKIITGKMWLSRDANEAIRATREDGLSEPVISQGKEAQPDFHRSSARATATD